MALETINVGSTADDGTGDTLRAAFVKVNTNFGTELPLLYQPLDADLTAIAALDKADGNFIVANGSAWVVEAGATVRASLGLVIGTDVQAWDADLDAWAGKTAPSGTVVGTSDTQTLTNKTLTSPIVNVGSDATGDVYYRDSGGALARLAAGTDGHVLKLASGLPSWAAEAGGSPGGSTTQLQYNNAGSFGGTAGLTWNSATSDLATTGRITLPATTGANAGVVYQGSNRFLHAYGSTESVYLGLLTGNLTLTGTRNVCIGAYTGFSLTSGGNNVLLGYTAGDGLTTGANNVAIGQGSLGLASTSSSNVAIGQGALGALSTASGNNTGIGTQAGAALNTGTHNVMIGVTTAPNITTGTFNIAIGASAGGGITTGSHNTVIGANLGSLSSSLASTTVIGNNGTVRLTMDGTVATFAIPVKVPSYTVATVPSASGAGAGSVIYVTDETGGATIAFSDATAWRRVSDRAVIS